jgi:hypothetical protein
MAYWEKTGWDYGRRPPEREEGAAEPGPYYPEYQVGGQEVHPAREYEYSHFERDVASPQREADWDWPDRPGLGPQRRGSVARRAPFQPPAYKWGVEQCHRPAGGASRANIRSARRRRPGRVRNQ